MKLSAPFVWLVVAIGVAEAAFPHAEGGLSDRSRHARLSNQRRAHVDGQMHRRDDTNTKKCKPRSSTLATPAPAQSTPAANKAIAQKPASSSAAPPPPANTPASQSSGTNQLNTLNDARCGPSGATKDVTAKSGPNGSLDWFNCGVEGGGWTPPQMTIKDVVTKDLQAAVNEPNSPFKNCAPYISIFEQFGNQFGIPAIFLASIAMQESSCNPDQTGGAGEQGLMQITVDKCGGAPGNNCKDPYFNISKGAAFFSSLLDQHGGNVLLAIGEYNGWAPNMTKAKATAPAYTGCCPCQNNLDYLTQFLNGWVFGVDPTGPLRIGAYFNLDICKHQ